MSATIPVPAAPPLHDPERDDGRLFRLAMASSGIGMAIVDLGGHWREVNPAFEKIFGYSADELVGHHVLEFTHPEDLELSRGYMSSLVEGRIPVLDAPKRYLRRDGSVLWAHLNVAMVHDEAGRRAYMIAQVRDISAQKQAEQALQALNRRLERRAADRTAELLEANQQLRQFAYGVSHDLRGPLRAIDGFAAQLERHSGAALDDTARDYLHRIRDNAGRMSGLIDGLLELSRATSAELKPQDVDLSLLAEWVGAELQDAEPDRQARIDVQQDLHVHGDERLLKSLLAQLLGNAWKFSVAGEPVAVEVRGARVPEGMQLSIRDRGRGFDMAYADKLFEPFQRLHGQAEGGGSGLGLAIAQRIVLRHRGRIWAESAPGAGSAFHIILPHPADGPTGNEDAP
ncbi:PAS domain S-box protein [Luteimonas gilva]|uniref:histidine kinase n=1 Tax=Luteimonas gilva TaxID=2572684 RepID=A0A4U5JUP9_9GAMM|nr:PAS domain-containing sensor histidine kinase [Luteimonas gilva]TKR30149.1 PAS domain S-box protein [Luteimonas gilva]